MNPKSMDERPRWIAWVVLVVVASAQSRGFAERWDPAAGRYASEATLQTVGATDISFAAREGQSAVNRPFWTELSATGAIPSERQSFVFVDVGGGECVLFGGLLFDGAFTNFNDTYRIDAGGAWTLIPTSGETPSPRFSAAGVFDEIGNRLIVFGGTADATDHFDTTFALDLATHEWTQLRPTGAKPAPRRDHAAVYDSLRHRMIVFGGTDDPASIGVFNDLHALDLGSLVWSEIVPTTGSLPNRRGHAAQYVAEQDALVISGGNDGIENRRETFLYSFADGTVTELVTSGDLPPGLLATRSFYHSGSNRLFIFGGFDGVAQTGDLFALKLNLGTWKQFNFVEGSPSPRNWFGFCALDDSSKVLLFGGLQAMDFTLNDTWLLTLPQLEAAPPIIGDPGDVIIGNFEIATGGATGGATSSATMATPFVFPDAFDLSCLGFSNTIDSRDIKWSFSADDDTILINGVRPLSPILMGNDDPTSPREENRLDINDLDPEQRDDNPFTVTFRNQNLSPIGGMTRVLGGMGIIRSETRNITLYASDCTTFSSREITVLTANNLSDSLRNPGFFPSAMTDFTLIGDDGGDWVGGSALGLAGSTSITPFGLCLTVAAAGDNAQTWFSPEDYIALKDNVVYRVRAWLTTDQTVENAIPFWTIFYDNFHGDEGFINFGGERWFMDNVGGANGIGRLQGRNHFTTFLAPSAVATLQWRGLLPGNNPDNANGAFTPAADAVHDMRIGFRVIDVPAGDYGAQFDSGTICIASVEVDALPLDALKLDQVVYRDPIASDTHEILDLGLGGVGVIDDVTNEARFQLNPVAEVDRLTLVPNVVAAGPPLIDFNGNGTPDVLNSAKFFPVRYNRETLYRLRVKLRSDEVATATARGVGSPDPDPVDVITLIMDTVTVELGQTDFITRASPGGPMDRAGSPRTPGETGGITQTYMSFFHTNGGTLARPSIFPAPDSMRPQVDMFNRIDLGSNGIAPSGADPVIIESIEIDRMVIQED